MYNLKHLFSVAKSGLSDMLPAVRTAFNDDRTDDNLDKVFGANPRYRILGITLAGLLGGEIVAALLPVLLVDNYILNEYVNWSAVVIGMVFALLFRRYLFESGHAGEDDFPWLAASLVPAAAALALIAFVKQLFGGSLDFIEGAPAWTGFGAVLVGAVNAMGVVAALSIAVAALCFSRHWIRALMDLAVQLFVFKIMVWITVLIIVEIGIVGPILASIIERVFNIRFAPWLADLADQITLAGLLSIAYGAIIGAVWTVCQQNFGTLLKEGDVRIITALKQISKRPKKPKNPKQPKKQQTGSEPTEPEVSDEQA